MALEKHFYNRLDAVDDITTLLLSELLGPTASVAVLGTLAMVGKYQPDLLVGVL